MSPDKTPIPENHRGRRARVRNGVEQRNPSSSTRPNHQPVIRGDEHSSQHPMTSLARDQGVYIPTFDQESFGLGEHLQAPFTQDQISYQTMLFQQLFSGPGGFPGTPDQIQNLLTTPSSSHVPHLTSIPTSQTMGNDTRTPTSQTMTNNTSITTCQTNRRGSSRQTALLRARNAPVTPSLATRIASARPPRPALNRDGMSGLKLTHIGVPEFPSVVTDNCNLDIADVGIGKGRKITKTTAPKPRMNDRAEIKPHPLQRNFDNTDAAKDISGLLRVHYRGDFYWDEVSAETRDLLWEEFGMRYRWDRKLEVGILEVWEALNRLCFTRMLQKAKLNHKTTRAKWLFPKYYRRLVKHWRSEKHVKIATRNSRNRRGKELSSCDTGVKAPPTYFGGSIGMMGYQRLVNAAQNKEQADGEVRPRDGLDLVSPLVYGATKSRNCSKFFDKYKGKKKGEQSDPAPSEFQLEPVPEWSRHNYQEIVERYWQFVEEKFATSPHLKPRPSDPYDVECWNKAIKGAKKGRILGLGSSFKIFDAGFGYRRPSHSTLQLSQDMTNEIFERVYDTLATQPGLDSSVRMELDERMHTIAGEFRTWVNGKAPMHTSGSVEDEDEDEDEYEDDEGQYPDE